jgi:serine/threonine-protein kinase HipA
MGRRSHARALSIWANGVRVGTWQMPARGGMELQYDQAWMTSSAGRPLSLSLPFGVDTAPIRGAQVASYFDNLLPDSPDIRKRLATRFKTDSTDAFDLLEAIGRDCVGAVQLLAPDAQPEGFDHIEGTPVSDEEIAALLQRTVATPGMGQDAGEDLRISLAGMQEKSALLWHAGQWMIPHRATPTSHILKLPLGLVGNMKADLTTSVENEWLCMNLLQAFGLPAANTRITDFAGQRVLSVERFDRQLHPSGTWLLRLPQEDFCQVFGVPPHRKYEADGGPGMQDLAKILMSSEHAEQDIETLICAQVLFWMLAAVDGHAKNFSIQLLPGGRYKLTPLYDVMSAWPLIGEGPNHWSWHKAKLAMAVAGKNKHYALKDIQRRHFNATAAKCGYGESAERLIERIVQRVPGAIEEVKAKLPAGFPQRVASSVFAGLQESADKLQQMPGT